MLTVFDILKFGGAGTGAIVAGRCGYATFGWIGAIIAVPLGLFIGALIGNVPWTICWAWMRHDLKSCSAAKLKERLQQDYLISHLIIAEWLGRGEPLEQFRGYVVELLRSPSLDQQRFGKGAARLWLPELLDDPSRSRGHN